MTFSEFVYTVLLRPAPLRKLANFVICRLIPDRILVQGATVWLNPADPVVCGALTLGVYEREEISFFCRHLMPGMTFVDVGANVGLYSALALHRQAAVVLAVEPHTESFCFLEKTVATNKGASAVFLENLAAGRETGELLLYSNPENKGDNRLYPDPMLPVSRPVSVQTLGALCEKHGISSINFIKIDVQGAEMLVLEGAKQILSNSTNCTILTEFWPEGLLKRGTDPKAYLDLFAELGFELRELRGSQLVPFDFDEMIVHTKGRKYRNIVGIRVV